MGKEGLLRISPSDWDREDRGVNTNVWSVSAVPHEERWVEEGPISFKVEERSTVVDLENIDDDICLGVGSYIDSVFEEQIEKGNGSLIHMTKALARKYYKDPLYFYFGVARTLEVLSSDVTREPISRSYLRKAYGMAKENIEIDGNLYVLNFQWHSRKLDSSLKEWRKSLDVDLEETVQDDFNLGFTWATMGYALREEDRKKS